MRAKLAITAYILITTTPLLLGFGYSLLYSFGYIGLMNKGFTTEHWLKLFESKDAIMSLFYSILVALGSLITSLVPALIMAYFLTFGKQNTVFKKILLLPLFVAPIIVGFLVYYMLSPTGILARIAFALHLISSPNNFPTLVNDSFAFGILAAHLFLLFPLFTFIFLSIAKKERIIELKQIATTLGTSKKDFITKIFIPLILKKADILIALYGLFLFGAYEIPLILGKQSPRMVSIFITEKLTKFNLNDIALGHAMAVVYTLLVFLTITIILRKKTTKLIPF
ncbi:MAG: hypothetical protein CVT95_05845 [Bacteroidetes bacterium HGW-Bacteroidetes-12]|nr:MAG: hypothetical protein CVT95_05845 [Bacteroidetes bacterium HGW-Bacteroidetes-12]